MTMLPSVEMKQAAVMIRATYDALSAGDVIKIASLRHHFTQQVDRVHIVITAIVA